MFHILKRFLDVVDEQGMLSYLKNGLFLIYQDICSFKHMTNIWTGIFKSNKFLAVEVGLSN